MTMQYNEKMKTKPVTVTIPEDVIQQVKILAESQGRSFSNMLTHLAKEGMKNKAA